MEQTAASHSQHRSGHGTSPRVNETRWGSPHGHRATSTYASIVGIAYFPVLVSMAPFMFGSFTSIIKLRGIPVLFLILGPDSKFLSYGRGEGEKQQLPLLRVSHAPRALTAYDIWTVWHTPAPFSPQQPCVWAQCYHRLHVTRKSKGLEKSATKHRTSHGLEPGSLAPEAVVTRHWRREGRIDQEKLRRLIGCCKSSKAAILCTVDLPHLSGSS